MEDGKKRMGEETVDKQSLPSNFDFFWSLAEGRTDEGIRV